MKRLRREMNYFHLTMLIAYSACRFRDLEREAQERGLQRAIEDY